MKHFTNQFRIALSTKVALFTFVMILSFTVPRQALAQPDHDQSHTLPAVGTSRTLGKVYGVTIEAKVNAPSYQVTPLQIACVFEYVEGDIFTSPPALPADHNGMVNLDKALHGLITELRKTGRFKGYALETLLIIPPPGTIKAKLLLLIGLGDRNKFSVDLMQKVGAVGMREALKLGVTSYSHASDIKDAGIDSPTGPVASNVVKGALDAYKTQLYLQSKKSYRLTQLTKFTLLSGQAYFEVSGQAIIAELKRFKE
jgi:hypothetical protein